MKIFELKNVKKYVSERLTINIDEFVVMQGERIGIVGMNGAGKTTLLHIMLGVLPIDSGEVISRGQVSWITQSNHPDSAVEHDLADNDSDQLVQKEKQRQLSVWNIKNVAVSTMSGGEQTRLKIAEALSTKPDVLVADEPTTHLDMAAAEQLGDALTRFEGTLLLVSHDRELLDRVCEKIVEVDGGLIKSYSGNYSQYLEAKEVERRQAAAAYEQYIKEKRSLEQAIAELRGKASKMTKAPKRMGNSEARLHKGGIKQRRAKVERNFKVLESRLERLEGKQKPMEREPVTFDQGGFPPMRGKWAIRFDQLSISIGDRKLLESFTYMIRPGKKIALIGPNGSGKTSLLRAIYEEYKKEPELKRDDIRLAGSVRLAYFHQQMTHLDLSKSLLDNIRSVSQYPEAMIRTVLARLHFKRDDVLKLTAVLSGGEKVKAGLAMVFLSESNVLMLDEPTNYLDIFTREELEEMLAAYPGTVLFASHDRRLIKKVADEVIDLSDAIPKVYTHDNETEIPLNGTEALEASRPKDDLMEEKMVLETELAEVISRISAPQPDDDPEQLERRYEELLAKLKSLKQQ